jgi:hypothetical protein
MTPEEREAKREAVKRECANATNAAHAKYDDACDKAYRKRDAALAELVTQKERRAYAADCFVEFLVIECRDALRAFTFDGDAEKLGAILVNTREAWWHARKSAGGTR